MKRLSSLAFAVVLAAAGLAWGQAAPLAAPTKVELKAGDFVAVCGDSITEQKQYSVFIEDYLLMCQPAADLRAMQAGWGGERAPGFRARMAFDVLPLKPTVATTCYGMNDGGYGSSTAAIVKTYTDNTRAIVQAFKAAGVQKVVVGSPGVVDVDTFKRGPEVYNKTLGLLRDAARTVAAEEGVAFANVFDPMMDVMTKAKAKYGKDYHVAGSDGVHPAANGHLVMAYAFLKALGCDGEIGTITAAASKAAPAEARAVAEITATPGHKVIRSDGFWQSTPAGLDPVGASITLESARYPFCFYGDPKDPAATRGVLDFLPFNQDLNRFTLIIPGAAADAKYKVTWSGEAQKSAVTKEFTGAQLAQGINLAAEFLDNPFSEAFAKVDAAVRAQQAYETPLTKSLLHNLAAYRDLAPEEKDALDRIEKKMVARDRELFDTAARTVAPVRHTVKIEAVGVR